MSKPHTKQKFFPTDPSVLRERPLEIVAKQKIPPRLQAQTPTQKVLLKKLRHWGHDILFAIGPAGTGKTYMCVYEAIKAFQNGDFEKIVITRPNVSSGDDIGFLPGTLNEKMAPWTRPIVDVFMEFYSAHEFKRMLDNEEIEIAPLAFMRGRTFKNSIVIGDEMQNATPDQMKMFLTRIGRDSKMIVTGDIEQHDRLDGGVSGLKDIMERFERREPAEPTLPGFITQGYGEEAPGHRYERLGMVKLGKADVVRHEVVSEVLDMYDEQ